MAPPPRAPSGLDTSQCQQDHETEAPQTVHPRLGFTGWIGVIARESETAACVPWRQGGRCVRADVGGWESPAVVVAQGVRMTSTDTAQRLVPEPTECPLHPEGERVWGTSIYRGVQSHARPGFKARCVWL